MKTKTTIIVINQKVLIDDDKETSYEFRIEDLFRYAMIENDKSRKATLFKQVAQYLFDNDIRDGQIITFVEEKLIEGENNENHSKKY